MTRCRACKRTSDGDDLCRACQLSLFQIDEIISSYLSGTPEPWIMEATREFDMLFLRDVRNRGYFNAAREAIFRFGIDRELDIEINDFEELHESRLKPDDILEVIVAALIVERDRDKLKPGALSRRFQEIRWSGFELNDPELGRRLSEIYGIVSLALTRVLIERKTPPKPALAILYLLSNHIVMSVLGSEIEVLIEPPRQEIAFSKLTGRQTRFMPYMIGGLYDGKTRLIRDIDEDGNMLLNDSIIDYLTRMRNRFRERERERERERDRG